MGTTLAGRGLWYGAVDASGNNRVFTQAQWEVTCAQAKAWGITVVHPKVCEGTILWYTDDQLKMLLKVAQSHGLVCVPYMYNYGGELGALDQEAQRCAHIGNIFGVVCADIEEKWEVYQGIAWATRFGQIIRQSYSGPIYVTSFGQPTKHPAIPWITLNGWMAGFLPQVYWSEWQEGGVSVIMPRVYQQWLDLDKHCHEVQKKPLAPIFPIISLDSHLPQGEVTTWLQKMGGYGYCGFWYDATYAPYASTILHAPLPTRLRQQQQQDLLSGEKEEPLFPPHHQDDQEAIRGSTLPPASPPLASSLLHPEAEEKRQEERPQGPMDLAPAFPRSLSSSGQGEYVTVLDMPALATGTSATDGEGSFLLPPGEGGRGGSPLGRMGAKGRKPTANPITPVPPLAVASQASVPSSVPVGLSLLSLKQLRLLWQSRKPSIPFDEQSPVVVRWCQLVEMEDGIGVPTEPETELTIEGEKIRYVILSSGKTIIYFYSLRRTLVL